jgi:Flp pilus assembly protein TadG
MNGHRKPSFFKTCKNEGGQVLPIVALLLVCLLGMVMLVVDLGDAFYSYRELQASTDAAALAGAQDLPNTTASATAISYSSVAGNKNVYANLPNVSMVAGYPLIKCLSTLTAQAIPCVAPANGNAIQVKQTVNVPMYFAKLFGISQLPLTATATAAMRGAGRSPYNVAIILDSTASMNSTDSAATCNNTRLYCATQGVQFLLSRLSPCFGSLSSCGSASGGNVSNPVDEVSLYTYPGVTSTTEAQKDYSCSGTPSIAKYSYPTLPTYQIVGFSSDYRSSDTATGLVGGSNLVKAVGGKSGCAGMQAVGGVGTYFAGTIYQAQADLVTAQAARPNSQNVMIILSDGDANASSGNMPGASTSTGVYPSTKNQCHQAITAADLATNASPVPTKVFSVAYGATASGCSTDSPAISPCETMRQIASSDATFYSDYKATGGSTTCISAASPADDAGLAGIFTSIAGQLTLARLIPDNTP